jgi:hypothetical protein
MGADDQSVDFAGDALLLCTLAALTHFRQPLTSRAWLCATS